MNDQQLVGVCSVGQLLPQPVNHPFEIEFSIIINSIIFAAQDSILCAKVAQLVEHDLAKVGVAGSNPVFRSKGRLLLDQMALFYLQVFHFSPYSTASCMPGGCFLLTKKAAINLITAFSSYFPLKREIINY